MNDIDNNTIIKAT